MRPVKEATSIIPKATRACKLTEYICQIKFWLNLVLYLKTGLIKPARMDIFVKINPNNVAAIPAVIEKKS